MTTKEIKALQFQNFKADSNAPAMACNYCGKKEEPTESWRFVDIKIADNADYTIVVCSRQCQRKFINDARVDLYVNAIIAKMKGMHIQQPSTPSQN